MSANNAAEQVVVTTEQLKAQIAEMRAELQAKKSDGGLRERDASLSAKYAWYKAGTLRKPTEADRAAFSARTKECPALVATCVCTECGAEHTRGVGDVFHCTKCPGCKGGGSESEKLAAQIAKLQAKLEKVG